MINIFICLALILAMPISAHGEEKCSEIFYECFDANDRYVSAQSYPCEKGLRQVKQKAVWNDPRKMEHGAVALKCEPCGPCYPHSWVSTSPQAYEATAKQVTPPSRASATTGGDVRLGMSMAEVRGAWGEPTDISKSSTETSSGTKALEVWIYQKDAYTTPSTLVFRNQVLSEITRGSNPKKSTATSGTSSPSTYSTEVQFVSGANGNCQTPDQIASDGKRCGQRAASVRTGGR